MISKDNMIKLCTGLVYFGFVLFVVSVFWLPSDFMLLGLFLSISSWFLKNSLKSESEDVDDDSMKSDLKKAIGDNAVRLYEHNKEFGKLKNEEKRLKKELNSYYKTTILKKDKESKRLGRNDGVHSKDLEKW